VDLLDQAVEHAYLMAAAEQFTRHETTDKAGSAGDQNPFWQAIPPDYAGGAARV
jgi:hypothetical protein